MKHSLKKIEEFYKSLAGLKVFAILKRIILKFVSGCHRHKVVLNLGYVGSIFEEEFKQKNMVLNCILQELLEKKIQKYDVSENVSVVDSGRLPFLNHSMDYVILLHALEFVSDVDVFLDEILRIMNTDGEILIIVPNRQGLWSWSESTPFGFGHPYSMKQLADLLSRKGFDIISKKHALFLPPPFLNKGYNILKYVDFLCLKYLKKMSGLNIIHAKKSSPVILMRPVLRGEGLKAKEKYQK